MPSYPTLNHLRKAAEDLPQDYEARRKEMDASRALAAIRFSTNNSQRKANATCVQTIAAKIEQYRSSYATMDKKYTLSHPEEFSRQLSWKEAVALIQQEAILGANLLVRHEIVVMEYSNDEVTAMTNSALVQVIDAAIGIGYTPVQINQCAEALNRVLRVIASVEKEVQWHPTLKNEEIHAKIQAMIDYSNMEIAKEIKAIADSSQPSSSAIDITEHEEETASSSLTC